jgi:hypothetical protein
MRYFCCDERRRSAILRHGTLNGIDFLEVDDDSSKSPGERQRRLFVHFLKDLEAPAAGGLTPANVRIEAAPGVTPVTVSDAVPGTGAEAQVLTVTVEEPGDFNPYTFRVVDTGNEAQPPEGFDPVLSQILFSFKAACDTGLDCAPTRDCPSDFAPAPEINYLAKDYASFRQLMLDRMATVLPSWTERHAADLGITLVELLAYVGDYLSYQQDAVATEAYLGTARRRVSVRRHARLIDYFMHDGSNARTWVCFEVEADITLPAQTRLYTRVAGLPTVLPEDSEALAAAITAGPEIFETMAAARLYREYHEMRFYTWGDRECCLPRGATRATLAGAWPNLQQGNVLIFEEVQGPLTGEKADADPSVRHAVRLTRVTVTQDPLGGRFTEADDDTPADITEIEWHAADALPFPFCVSSKGEMGFQENVSVARGNVVLADHGMTIADEPLGVVPASKLQAVLVGASGPDRCEGPDSHSIPVRFRPALKEHPVTQAAPFPYVKTEPDPRNAAASASAAITPERADVRPDVRLTGRAALPSGAPAGVQPTSANWKAVRDLLGSEPTSTDFAVEVENEGTAYIRFGDGQHGIRPPNGTEFTAHYRVGNGAAGNIGADSLFHASGQVQGVLSLRNPLPARGGRDPETIEEVRQYAPSAFRVQERAVTPDDYALMAQRHPEVQRAAATLRWTGSWYTVFVSIDRKGGLPVDENFRKEMRRFLERFRMAGQDLEVNAPKFVSLEIELHVCVEPGYLAAHIRSALLQQFNSGVSQGGKRGLFHPDNFTLGQPVTLSPLIAAAQATPGVSSVRATIFQRQGVPEPDDSSLRSGRIAIGRLEVARLENDPNHADHGVFRLKMDGGR